MDSKRLVTSVEELNISIKYPTITSSTLFASICNTPLEVSNPLNLILSTTYSALLQFENTWYPYPCSSNNFRENASLKINSSVTIIAFQIPSN